MTLTYRSTVGRRLTVTEGDGNIAHLATQAGWASVVNYGAVADDITDNSAAFVSTYNAIPDGGCIFIPPAASTYALSTFNVSGKKVTVFSTGATISTTSSTGAIYKTDHDNRLTVVGLRFVGNGIPIHLAAVTSQTMTDDFQIERCRFENDDYGIYLEGMREGRIIGCSFDGINNKGIYRTATVNTSVVECYWKNTRYMVNDDGDGTGFSAGLRVLGGVGIGCSTGILSQRSDWVYIGGAMIDYCDNAVQFVGVDTASIMGNYLTSRTSSAVINVTSYSGAEKTNDLKIIGNQITCQFDNTSSDGLNLHNVAGGIVADNSITFWWRYGVQFDGCTNLRIESNNISKDTGTTVVTPISVYESSGGSDSNTIRFNVLSDDPNVANAQIQLNRGFVTQNGGEVTFVAGTTTSTIAHGLDYTPTKAEVALTPTNASCASSNPYINSVDATNIGVGFTVSTNGTAGLTWQVTKKVYN